MTLSTIQLMIHLQCLEMIALITIQVQKKIEIKATKYKKVRNYKRLLIISPKNSTLLRQEQAESKPANETMKTKVVNKSEVDTDNIRRRIKRLRKCKILNQTSGSNSDANTKKSDTT